MLSDNRHLRRAAAFFESGRALYALHHLPERQSISIEDPDVVLREASELAAHSLAEVLSGDKTRKHVLGSILCGLQAQSTAQASTHEWDAIGYQLRNHRALFNVLGEAKTFAAVHESKLCESRIR